MRRGTFVLAMAGVLATTTAAAGQVDLGVRAGLSLADLRFEAGGVGIDLDQRTGLMAGVFAEIPLSRAFSLQPGLNYVQKGGEAEAEGVTAGLHLGYIQVPVLFKYAFPTGGSVGVHLQAGPALALEVSCKNAASAGQFDATLACDQGGIGEDHVETKALDFGTVFGGGVSFPVGETTTLLIDLAYDLGFADIWDERGVEAKNRALYLTAGLRFVTGS